MVENVDREEEFNRQEIYLEDALKRAIRRSPADFHLLSGGIDSSLIAALDPKTPAITVTIQGKGIDLRYAQQTAEFLGINWQHIEISPNEALSYVPDLVKHMHSYDPGIVNDIAPFVAIRYARSLGAKTIRTGDGGDDFFGGYSFSWSKDGQSLDSNYHRIYLEKLNSHLRFSSDIIAESFRIRSTHPYLDPEVAALAIEMDLNLKVQVINSEKTGDVHYDIDHTSIQKNRNVWSKLILRRLARKHLPGTIINRSRSDLEYGVGSYILEDMLANQITEEKIVQLENQGTKFWNNNQKPETRKMHARLREIFEQNGLEIPKPIKGEYSCSWCLGGIPIERRHCFTCGAWHEEK